MSHGGCGYRGQRAGHVQKQLLLISKSEEAWAPWNPMFREERETRGTGLRLYSGVQIKCHAGTTTGLR